ncbi:GDSL esterase/lipase At5g03980-like [Apium graveolens]|uniref:GDSL esterase/lipase At5g03980-like n=1 Tax=Apium graveolens TaxID=4045 RepID=UPI003D795AD6
MFSNNILSFQFLMLCSLFLHFRVSISFDPHLPDISILRNCNIDKIYQFGDSLSDTGNHILENPFDQCSKPPYGSSFFENPTGRCSDGLLMIDYIASAAGIPFLSPYLDASANFSHGANFAVVGSTALSVQAMAKKNILASTTNCSLEIQLEWLSKHLFSLCKSDLDCRQEKLKNALFMVGETGGNDFNFALLQGKTIEETKSMVPEVVEVIMEAVRRVINLGAVQVVVPGNFPIGCIPLFLTAFQTTNATAYDKHQCLKDLNDFAIFQNQYLQQAISILKKENPNTIILYADYYNAFLWLLENCSYLGFDVASALKACCGGGGKYNYSLSRVCGSINNALCSHPDQYISWDGMHMTQKAYVFLAKWLVADLLPQLNCNADISYHSDTFDI